jgi:diphthamide synthase (EF-2-diphthine--ammonia ligase)
MNKPKKYIASCSFGKDSIATILLALENGEPLDGVVFCLLFG